MSHVTIYISECQAVISGYYPECTFRGMVLSRSKSEIEILNQDYG